MSDASCRTAVTYRCEKFRAVSAGIIETAGATFLLLIAVRHFDAGANAKALIASGGSAGLLAAPLVVWLVERLGWTTAVAASRLSALGAWSFVAAALFPVLPVFVACSVLAMACASACIPLMTQIYQENYPENGRGRLFSRTMMIRIATTVVFSDLGGRLLSGHIGYFRWLLLLFAAAFAAAAVWLKRCPSKPLSAAGGKHPFGALRYVRDDKIFRLTLISWMFLGFGTLMMQPMRVEYLANPQYRGEVVDVMLIALLTGVIPNLVRLFLSPVWGWLFDHMNFFLLRVVLNVGFALGILTFFLSDNLSGLVWGAVIFGVSNAGGDVAWSLWVTKFAPPERVADYMSAHTCFTGLRGVAAPIVSFQLIRYGVSLPTLGWAAAGMIAGSILLLLPEVRWGRTARRASALVEEVSE